MSGLGLGLERLPVHAGTWGTACSLQGGFMLFCLLHCCLHWQCRRPPCGAGLAKPPFQLHACSVRLLGQHLMLSTRGT